jgi:hypothetical protein
MGNSARRPAIAAGVLAVAFAIGAAAQAPVKPAPKPDGLFHSELSLLGRTASISYAPDLRGPAAGGPTRIGELQTNGALRLGDITVGKPGLAPLRFDLLLEPAGDGWQLDITGPATPGSTTKAASLGKVALTRQKSAAASPTLSAALVPVARDTAQLVLKWADLTATAGVQFQEVQLPARPAAARGRQTAPVNRNHDDENVGARATMLSQLNESALVDPQGARVSVTFARTFPKGTQSQSAAGTTRRAGLVVDGPDFGRLMSTRDGAVVELTEAPALRLSIDRAVRAGNVTLRPGNQSAGFPGAYSLWLKRAGPGWRLVINQEPDVWGTQRDPKSDVGEVDLTYTQSGDATRPLGVALEPISADRWRLVLGWGPHDWATIFSAAK